MRSSLIDRLYILLILIMYFFLPTLTIVASYVTILLTVRETAPSWHKMADSVGESPGNSTQKTACHVTH